MVDITASDAPGTYSARRQAAREFDSHRYFEKIFQEKSKGAKSRKERKEACEALRQEIWNKNIKNLVMHRSNYDSQLDRSIERFLNGFESRNESDGDTATGVVSQDQVNIAAPVGELASDQCSDGTREAIVAPPEPGNGQDMDETQYPHATPAPRPLSKAALRAIGKTMDIVRASLLDTVYSRDMTARELRRLGVGAVAVAGDLPDDAVIRKHRTRAEAEKIFKLAGGV